MFLGMRWPQRKGWTLSYGQGLPQRPAQVKHNNKNSTNCRLQLPWPTQQTAPRPASPWTPGSGGPCVQGSPICPACCDLIGVPLSLHMSKYPRGEEDGVGGVSLKDGTFLSKRVLTPLQGTVKSSRDGTGQLVHFPLLLVGAQEEG